MASPVRVLLQTTVQTIAGQWHIGRCSMLQGCLAGLVDSTAGLAAAQFTFHHFAGGLACSPETRRSIRHHVRNVAQWLASRTPANDPENRPVDAQARA